MSTEIVQVLGLLAQIYLLVVFLVISLALVIALFLGLKLTGLTRRRMAGALARGRGGAEALERGTRRSARVAAAPLLAGRRVSGTGAALWRRLAGSWRAWRGIA